MSSRAQFVSLFWSLRLDNHVWFCFKRCVEPGTSPPGVVVPAPICNWLIILHKMRDNLFCSSLMCVGLAFFCRLQIDQNLAMYLRCAGCCCAGWLAQVKIDFCRMIYVYDKDEPAHRRLMARCLSESLFVCKVAICTRSTAINNENFCPFFCCKRPFNHILIRTLHIKLTVDINH